MRECFAAVPGLTVSFGRSASANRSPRRFANAGIADGFGELAEQAGQALADKSQLAVELVRPGILAGE